MLFRSFVFDNEKWAHVVRVAPFAISRRAVTNGEYRDFIEATGHAAPRYWRKVGGDWQVRRYDRWLPLPAEDPVVHVSWHEAGDFCAWARRRLPSEAEWQAAANAGVLEARASGVWEWTSSRFLPFDGFAPDPYKEYSAPWFVENHRVLRGGSFASTPRLGRAAFRNFFKPERADVFCGFRTCALD